MRGSAFIALKPIDRRVDDRPIWIQKARGNMKKTTLAGLSLAVFLPFLSSAAGAGPIESACVRSDRAQANAALCRCIDSVAQQTLTRSEQRRAASFFRDPDLAQEVRMSKRESDNAFWERYRAFGQTAEQYCAGR
jgi:hypothetical protein